MTTRRKVTEAEWREKDRGRAMVIYLLGGVAAAVLTAVLYIF